MSTEDVEKIRKYGKQKNIGIVLITVGIILIGIFLFFFIIVGIIPFGIFLLCIGIGLFSIGLYYAIHSSKQKISKKITEELPIESQVELDAKRFKSNKKSGISLMIIGIVLSILGIIFWFGVYMFGIIFGIILWVSGGPLFFIGVGLVVYSVSIKKRMKKLEKS